MPPLTLSTFSEGVRALMRALPLTVLTWMLPPSMPSMTSGALITSTSSEAALGTCSSSVVGAILLSPPQLNQPEPPCGSTLISRSPLLPVIASGLAPSPRRPLTCTSLRSHAITFTVPAILLMLTRAVGVASWRSWIGVSARAWPMHRHSSRGR